MKIRITTTTDHYKIVQALLVNGTTRYYVMQRPKGLRNLFKWKLHIFGESYHEAMQGYQSAQQAYDELMKRVGREVVRYKDITNEQMLIVMYNTNIEVDTGKI